jgi:membrane protein implicated in regulation of membrane protease activity
MLIPWHVLAVTGALFLFARIRFYPSRSWLSELGVTCLLMAPVTIVIKNPFFCAIGLTLTYLIIQKLTRRFSPRLQRHSAPVMPSGNLIGKEALVTRTVPAQSKSGLVLQNNQQWQALSLQPQPIPEGTKVVIMNVQHNKVVVSPKYE